MMRRVSLGKTGLEVSPLGLGTVKFGRNRGVKYPEAFSLPSDQEILKLLSIAQDSGINLLDTAPAYGTSEERLGKLLRNRHDWIICTKAGEEFNEEHSHFDFSAKGIRHSLERSLKRLKTDVIDILLIHSDGRDSEIIEKEQVFQTMADLKKAGLIRAYGMSTKTVPGGILAVDHADLVMVTYNVLQQEEKAVIDYAHQHHKGIFVKKALASGHLENLPGKDPVAESFRFVFSEPGVHSVILGTINGEHLLQAVNHVSDLNK